ncbi:MAG: radical SAM protein [Candidatus Omnitrophica bacterium]|nr:radical SAM protein [Candidatus Omnitrophota bacterium]
MKRKDLYPSYLNACAEGKLEEKIDRLNKILLSCALCPRECKVNRIKGEKGYCGGGKHARVSSVFAHFGEESCLVGQNGSGTIFFSFCNLKCVFCQNYEISHLAQGKDVSKEELAGYMLRLQKTGCHNINLVTPTHFVPQIIEALRLAIGEGLTLPLVYNCGGYESAEVIDILDGVVDIYMPDAKFSSPHVSERLCNVTDYFDNLKIVLKKMHNQVGDSEIVNKIAKRGLLIRHLVMPNDLAGTKALMQFIAKEISLNAYINIMDQYRPCGEASNISEISRFISAREYLDAVEIARSFGLNCLFRPG